MQSVETKTRLHQISEWLRNPLRMRFAVAACAIGIALLGLATPAGSKIQELRKKLDQESRRQRLAEDVELLRAQCEIFQDRIPKNTDANEWIQYVLGGIRSRPLQLVNLDSEEERRVGSYRVVTLRVEVRGGYRDLDDLLYWLETNERLFRVDSINLSPIRGEQEQRRMQLTLLGLRA